MRFALDKLWPDTFYQQSLTVMSVVIVIFAGWLAGMMISRMVADRRASGHDLAALMYVTSTMILFLVIAGRTAFSWPDEVSFTIVFIKMVGVVLVTIWARITKQTSLHAGVDREP